MVEPSCPSDAELLSLVAGDTSQSQIAQHVLACTRCSSRVERLRNEVQVIRRLNLDGGLERTKPVQLPAERFRVHRRRLPSHIGRYFVIAELGEGGQAIVYRALAPTSPAKSSSS